MKKSLFAAILLSLSIVTSVSAGNSITVSPTNPTSSETQIVEPDGSISWSYTGDPLYMTISIPGKYDCTTHYGCARVKVECTQFNPTLNEVVPSWYGFGDLTEARTGAIIFGTYVNGSRYAYTVPGASTDCVATVYRRDNKGTQIPLATYAFAGTL
jgi:hypothetical protein